MKRSQLARGATPMKVRQCSGPNCEATFEPRRMEHTVCSPRCLIAKRKADEKAARDGLKTRKAALKTPRQLEQECRRIVQAIARVRDRLDGCISCDKGPNWQGQWHGSHFRSVGACSSLSLNLWNVHKACSECNHHKSGNLAEYRPRLILKSGQARVDWLMAQNGVIRRSREYLERFKRVMGKRLRRMEKRI